MALADQGEDINRAPGEIHTRLQRGPVRQPGHTLEKPGVLTPKSDYIPANNCKSEPTMHRLLLISLAVVLGLVAGLTAPKVQTYVSRRGTAPPRKLLDAQSRFPNIQLYTQNNEAVRFYDDLVKDRIVLVNFMYTTCKRT